MQAQPSSTNAPTVSKLNRRAPRVNIGRGTASELSRRPTCGWHLPSVPLKGCTVPLAVRDFGQCHCENPPASSPQPPQRTPYESHRVCGHWLSQWHAEEVGGWGTGRWVSVSTNSIGIHRKMLNQWMFIEICWMFHECAFIGFLVIRTPIFPSVRRHRLCCSAATGVDVYGSSKSSKAEFTILDFPMAPGCGVSAFQEHL